MEHIFNEDFWGACRKLPPNVRRRVPQKIQILRQNPRHPSLRLKKVGDLWAIRVSKGYRALAQEEEGSFIWFWVGPHDAYEQRL